MDNFFENYKCYEDEVGRNAKGFIFCIYNDDMDCEWEFDVNATFEKFLDVDGAGNGFYNIRKLSTTITKAYRYDEFDMLEEVEL